MAGIVVAVGVGDADDRPVQRVVGIAHRLDEDLAQEQRKACVAVTCQSLAQSVGHFLFPLTQLSFRGASKRRTRNLEIPRRPGMTAYDDCRHFFSTIRPRSPLNSMLQNAPPWKKSPTGSAFSLACSAKACSRKSSALPVGR